VNQFKIQDAFSIEIRKKVKSVDLTLIFVFLDFDPPFHYKIIVY